MRSKQTQELSVRHLIFLLQRGSLNFHQTSKLSKLLASTLLLILGYGGVLAQNPLAGNQGFQLLSEGNFTFTGYSHVHGSMAVGGNLTLNCSGVLAEICMDGVSSYVFPGDGTNGTGLLVKGGVTWTNGGAKVLGNKYMHIGSATGCIQSDNGVNMSTQVLPTGGTYNQAKRIEGTIDQTPSPAVFQTVSFDFAGLFNTYRNVSGGMAACANNVQLFNASNAAISGNTVSSAQNVQVNSLANGVNYLDLTQSSLNNITELKFNAGALPSASKLLVITVPLTSNFVWNNSNLPALSGSANGPYIIWNFTGATSYNLTINTASLIIGTIFAPNHNLIKSGTGDIDGNIIAKTISMGLGEIHYYPFNGNVPLCAENCTNGLDDDHDGLIDAADPNCSCSSPILSFKNPSLVSGTAGAVGAVYEFANVLAGTKARITLVSKSHSDIDITSIDEPASSFGGFDDAFQPIIDYNWLNNNGSFDPAGEKSVTFKIDFLDATTGLSKQLPIVNATGLDIDGSSVEVIEFIESSGFNAYEIESPTNLTLSGGLKAKGTLTTLPGIDETALSNMISFAFHNKSSITITFGGEFNGVTYDFGDSGVGDSDEKRLNSLYLKCYAFDVTVACPTIITNGGGAICAGQTSLLTSNTTGGTGTVAYQWQSSADSEIWVNIGGATNATYSASPTATTTYYRLTATFSGNPTCGTIYSNALSVSLGTVGCTETCNNFLDDDGDGLVDGADPDCLADCGTTGLLLQRWTGISGVNVTDLTANANYPNSPSETATLTSFDGPDNYADNYGSRVRGFILPSITGAYTFNLTSDDGSILYLSPDDKAANKAQIASVSGWTATNGHTTYPSQTSATINLVAGKYYYVELLHKEGTGGDHFQVYWKTPANSVWTIVPQSNLRQVFCPVENCSNGVDDDNDGLADSNDGDCMTFCPTGTLNLERWTGITGTSISALTGNAAFPNSPNFTGTINSFDGPDDVSDNFGTRVRGYIEPSISGSYVFNLTGDDDCALYLSTNVQPASKVLIASITGWTTQAEYTKYPSQTSANIALTAGQKYYVELIHKEGTGGDHFQVYWKTPINSTWTIIPGANLRPLNCSEICGNGTDDDSDGMADCADSDCNLGLAVNAGADATICAGLGANLSASATGGTSPYTFAWSNSLGSGATKTVSPIATTTYTVTVTSASGCTAADQIVVTVNPSPTANAGNDVSICAGKSTTLTASGGTSYAWSNSLGSGATKTVTPSATTTYTVTVTNASGCTATDQVVVTVNSVPVANAGADATICSGSSTTLTASGGTTYAWSNSLGSGATKTVSPTINTTYTVTVTNANGCTATDQVVVNVNASPVASAGADVGICNGTNTALTASATGGVAPYTYIWNNSLGAGISKTVSPSSSSTYIVTVTGNNGCTSSAQVNVTVNAVPVANAGADNTICTGGLTILTASGSGAIAPYSYSWSNGAILATTTVSPVTTTSYTVTVTSANGCFSTDQAVVNVQNCVENCGNGLDDDSDGLADCADSDCGPAADAGPDISICAGNTAFLSVGVTGGNSPYSYVWSGGLGSGATKTVTPTVTTTYSVTVTSASGCTSSDQIKVTVNSCSENCTNGIDDDGDGLVDCADPSCSGITAPVLANDSYTTCPGMTYSNRVTYNDGNLNNPQFTIATQPQHGTVTIDWTGKFTYTPNSFDCTTDYFIYQVCNLSTGCCAQATVSLTLGDNTLPILTNVPADLTISCDDAVPPAQVVTAFDDCPGLYMDFDESSTQNYVGACGSYTITRTWSATDFCGNSVTDEQKIFVLDQTKPEIFQVYTLENGAKLVAGFAQRVSHDWKYIKFPITFKSMPAVFAGLSSNVDVVAATVQVRHVSTQGFEVRLREEEAQNNIHGLENVSWVAVEVGTNSGSAAMEVGTLANINDQLANLNFSQSYASTPLFFSSLITNAQSDPSTLRHSNLTGTGVELFAQEEQSADAETARLNESIAYWALASSTTTLKDKDGNVFGEAGKVNLTNAWSTVSLSRNYTKPVVIFGGLTNNDNQPVVIRARNLLSNKFEARLQEWNYQDGSHAAENLSWMVIEGSIPAVMDFYCGNKADLLQPNLNIFAVDNCDDLVAFAYNENEAVETNGMISSHTWTAIDDCGNTTLLSRTDTCKVAAVRVKALLFGAVTGNGGGNTMRDNLRTQNLLPVVEPYSEMPSLPHVNIEHPMVTICHHSGQADQQTMSIKASELQEHLAHGDLVGACTPLPPPLPTGATNAQYRTKADGLWTAASTWVGGNIPPSGNNVDGVSISIEHDVVLPIGNLFFKSNSKLWVTNGSLTVLTGNIRLQDASLYANNAVINVPLGYLYAWTGNCTMDIQNSVLNVGDDFANESGKRYLKNVCVTVVNDMTCGFNVSSDSLFNVTASVGGVFRVFNNARMYMKDSNIKLVNGNFTNESGCSLSGAGLTLLVENGSVVNSGAWALTLNKLCVAGSIGIPTNLLPPVEECGNIANLFPTCTLDNLLGSDEGDNSGGNETGGSNGNSGGGNNANVDQAVAVSKGFMQPTLLQNSGNQAVVDWLLLELRNVDNPADVQAYATVVLNRNGEIVSEEGDSVIIFHAMPEEEYYVSIRHRNHLGLMTEYPEFLTISNPPLIDFTDLSTPIKGGTGAGKNNGGKRTFWGGDFNGDGRVIYQGPNNDVFYLFSKVLSNNDNTANLANFIVIGYEGQDFNMDGKVIYQGPNNDRAPLLYHSVLAHTGNLGLLANYIVMDLIP